MSAPQTILEVIESNQGESVLVQTERMKNFLINRFSVAMLKNPFDIEIIQEVCIEILGETKE